MIPDEKKKRYVCKVGTKPALVILFRKYKIEVGKRIKFRYVDQYHQWKHGRIWKVNDDGYFFIELR